jgi:hypothetical protein
MHCLWRTDLSEDTTTVDGHCSAEIQHLISFHAPNTQATDARLALPSRCAGKEKMDLDDEGGSEVCGYRKAGSSLIVRCKNKILVGPYSDAPSGHTLRGGGPPYAPECRRLRILL